MARKKYIQRAKPIRVPSDFQKRKCIVGDCPKFEKYQIKIGTNISIPCCGNPKHHVKASNYAKNIFRGEQIDKQRWELSWLYGIRL